MGGKDSNYQIVYRGQVLERYEPGGWVFFQRPRECGGGYWFGRTYDDSFWLEFVSPVSLSEGLQYLIHLNSITSKDEFCDNFELPWGEDE